MGDEVDLAFGDGVSVGAGLGFAAGHVHGPPLLATSTLTYLLCRFVPTPAVAPMWSGSAAMQTPLRGAKPIH